MSCLRPFRALRPLPNKAQQVAAVPYDVVSRSEADELAKDNTSSFLHVSKAEIDLPASIDPYSDAVYHKARDNFHNLIETVPLVQEKESKIYLYRLKYGDHTQTGIAATFSIDEYDRGLIKKHERTRKDKEDDRTRHLLALEAQTGPVFLVYRNQPQIRSLMSAATSNSPLFDFTASDGVTHTLWSISETEPWVQAFKLHIPCLYIADGHHRAAAASRANKELSQKDLHLSGPEGPGYGFFLAVAFPDEELRVLPYNRVLKDLNGRTALQLLEALKQKFEVTVGSASTPKQGCFSMFLENKWYDLVPKPSLKIQGRSDIDSLDVSVLQNEILDPLFGIKDPRTDSRIDFVGGIHGVAELEARVRANNTANGSNGSNVAFALHATSVDEMMKIADAGEIMPPKSTWFEPKLRDGLLSHVI